MPNETPSDPGQQLDWLLANGLLKLEITGGVPTWEMSPSPQHVRASKRITNSVQPTPGSGCGCFAYEDLYVRFLDGSIKRPDITIFCADIPDSTEALPMIPEAVVEVVSSGSVYKDYQLNPQFYLAQGVKDVIIFDPASGIITHYRTTAVTTLRSPVVIDLLCGCEVRV